MKPQIGTCAYTFVGSNNIWQTPKAAKEAAFAWANQCKSDLAKKFVQEHATLEQEYQPEYMEFPNQYISIKTPSIKSIDTLIQTINELVVPEVVEYQVVR